MSDENEIELREAPFVAALVPDPENVPESLLVVGYPGRSTEPDRWRLYLAPDLSDFVEFDRADVLHAEVIEAAGDEPERTRVWIKATARSDGFQSEAASEVRSFLEGDIAQAFIEAGRSVQRVHAGGSLSFGLTGNLKADPTLFHAKTCALSSCLSDITICTNSGQTTCDPALCFPNPKAFLG